MPASYNQLIKKLQSAINLKFDERILINHNQWYSDREKRPVSLFVVKKSIHDDSTNKERTVELFKTYSQIQLLLYLRDYWYTLNGWEIPYNKEWEDIKSQYDSKKGRS